jgi:exodeoxyribonuclease-1
MTESFLWFDLETFGRNPRTSRISQFAAIRTDFELNPIGEPVSLFCKPADDFLPEPEAAIITGITPQYAFEAGLCEAEFMAAMHEQFNRPGTCGVGFNSIRFDDEFVRFGFYRNFFDAYEREYAGGNSRWDLLDVSRFFYTLRPDGLNWPLRDDGMPSFKLEHLAKANDCFEGEAHEALSDVRSLVNLARKLKSLQPKLWHYALNLRDKAFVANLLTLPKHHCILHISGQFSAAKACSALMLPIMPHPVIKNRTIAVELAPQALQLLEYNAQQISNSIFTKSSELPEGEVRIGIKEIHHNRCPALIGLQSLTDAELLRWKIESERLQLDLGQAESIRQQLLSGLESIRNKLTAVFSTARDFNGDDPDGALYDGFIDRADKVKFAKARSSKGQAPLVFNDPRLTELYFRYKARNWPESLDASERQLWDRHKWQHLSPEAILSYQEHINDLISGNPAHAEVLESLKDWVIEITAHQWP